MNQPIFTWKATTKLPIAAFSVALVVFVSACGAGPTSRHVDGKWDVSINICSTDPKAAPDRGDIRSEIRKHVTGNNRAESIATFTYLNRKVARLHQRLNTSSRSISVTRYRNTANNSEIDTMTFASVHDANKHFKEAFHRFFRNEPNLDSDKALSFCLYRGQ